MVDTITMQVNLTCIGNSEFLEEVRQGKRTYLERSTYNRGKKREHLCYIGGIAPFSLFYNASCHYVCITFNPKLVIGRYPINSDVDNIEEAVKDFICNMLKLPAYYIKDITLNRIDYNIDYRITCEEERQIIYDLMKIASNKLGKVVKSLYITAITYNPENGYVELIVYDKEMERRLAIRYDDYISPDDVDKDFKGIIRIEVRIKNRKLNYYKYNANWGLAKDLSSYLSEDMKEYFFKQYSQKVWFAEPFYRIDVALKLIKNNTDLKINMKNKLCDLLKSIRRNGYSKSRENYGYLKRFEDVQNAIKNGFSSTYIERLKNEKLCGADFVTFNNYIKKIRELGINPLTFSRNYELEKIENFARYKGDEEQCNHQKN